MVDVSTDLYIYVTEIIVSNVMIIIIIIIIIIITIINNSIAKWRLSAPDIQDLPLLAASSEMRLLPWLANPGNLAMSPPRRREEGKKGTHRTDIIYTVETREGREEQPRNYPQT